MDNSIVLVDSQVNYNELHSTNDCDVGCALTQAVVDESCKRMEFVCGVHLSCQLLKRICYGYGYNTDLEAIDKVYKENFFESYFGKCGYRVTGDLLLVINNYKDEFIRKIDCILTNLISVFDFLNDRTDSDITLQELMDKICSSFSNHVYDLRPKCIDVLQFGIIPAIIKTIFSSKIINGGIERKMTYSEMEQLFLYYATTLERLIMARIMNYWVKFCDKNKQLLSLIPGVDYSDPFARANCYDGTSIPRITHPAAFVCRFGKCISFMADFKINSAISDFFIKFDEALKECVNFKYHHIIHNSTNVAKDIGALNEKVFDLMKDVFDKKIIDEKIEDNFSNFLNNVLIWDECVGAETNKVLIFSIIEHMRNFLASIDNFCAHRIIKDFQETSSSVEKCNLLGVDANCISAIEEHWGLKLHPEDDKTVSFIRRKFSSRFKNLLTKLFSDMLYDGYVPLTGKVIDNCSWTFVSDELYPLAMKLIDPIVKEEYEELDVVLSEARLVSGDGKSYSFIVRKATVKEKNYLSERARNFVHKSLRNFIRSSWLDAFNDNPRDVDGDCSRGLGFKLHYVDVYSIFRVIDGCLSEIDPIVYDRFARIISSNCKFDDAITGKFSWFRLHRKILPIIEKEVKHIIEARSKIIENTISKSRILVESRVYRESTNEDKYIILRNVNRIIYERLRFLCGRVWSKVISSFRLDSDYTVVVGPRKSDAKADLVGRGSLEVVKNVDGSTVSLCHEDDVCVSATRKSFSHNMHLLIRNRFFEIIKSTHIFGCGDIISKLTRGNLPKDILHIAKKEVKPIIDKEYVEINNILLKSRVIVSNPDGSRITREIILDEVHSFLKIIMGSVYRQSAAIFVRAWNRIIKLLQGKKDFDVSFLGVNPTLGTLKSGSINLRERDKFDLDSVRLEFVGRLGSAISEVVESSLSGVDISPVAIYDLYSFISKMSCDLFKEGGFLDRVESILSVAQVGTGCRSYRILTDEERGCMLREFVDGITVDRDCYVRLCIKKIRGLGLLVVLGRPSSSVHVDHSYARTYCH
ncbi:hypothetical protein [Candidatus Ichthyocystis hellenicum]|uniref:hypothetical protein n=1 Tax=Candidatus Ichthyocystis hellenicum TaxID=1561003 RepID=UPI001111BEF7|nr:hypothetical protein [Candidatus Ichthyocystis hellenicum]